MTLSDALHNSVTHIPGADPACPVCQSANHNQLGKPITGIELTPDSELLIRFQHTTILFRDTGQCCCEDRYMRTDDDISSVIGARYLGYELKDAPSIEFEYCEHEVQFLDIRTSAGTLTFSNHNEHNGYYGGFNLQSTVVLSADN
jgi:hypothetical protein